MRSGVTGVTDPLTAADPAFNVVTTTRPMTADELDDLLRREQSSSRRGASKNAARPLRPGCVAGRSVGRRGVG